jgi:hypothetical protein
MFSFYIILLVTTHCNTTKYTAAYYSTLHYNTWWWLQYIANHAQHDSFIREMIERQRQLRQGVGLCKSRLIVVCAMIQIHIGGFGMALASMSHDAFACAVWLKHVGGFSTAFGSCVTWLIYTWHDLYGSWLINHVLTPWHDSKDKGSFGMAFATIRTGDSDCQGIAVCCSVLLCVAMCCCQQCAAVCCSVLQCVAVCCSVCSVLLHVVMCCIVLQSVAVMKSVAVHLICSLF